MLFIVGALLYAVKTERRSFLAVHLFVQIVAIFIWLVGIIASIVLWSMGVKILESWVNLLFSVEPTL